MKRDYETIDEILNKYKEATNQKKPTKPKTYREEKIEFVEVRQTRKPSQKKNSTRVKRVGAGVLAALSLAGAIYFTGKVVSNKKEAPQNIETTFDQKQTTETTANFEETTLAETKQTETSAKEQIDLIDEIANHVTLKHFNSKASDPDGNYYCLDEDYAIKLAKSSLENVYDKIKKANPASDLLGLLESGIIDEYLLTSIGFVESNYRFQNSDHSVFANSSGVAFGMTQAQIPTIETINAKFSKYGANFSVDSLKNPQNALEFTAYDLLFNLAYFGAKELDYKNEDNIDSLRLYCAASYYHGCNGALKMLREDMLGNSAYAQKIMNKYNSLLEQYNEFEK